MSEKTAHVVVVGLGDEQYQKLHAKTLTILHGVDQGWQLCSHSCATMDEAFALAAGLKNIDIIYIARDDAEPERDVGGHTARLILRAAEIPNQPVLSYTDAHDGKPRYKLPTVILQLWKDRNKSQQ